MKVLEVYYVDDFGGRIPDEWLGVGGSPDDCWHRVEVYEEQSPLDPRTPLPSSVEGLLALNRAIDSVLESESPC